MRCATHCPPAPSRVALAVAVVALAALASAAAVVVGHVLLAVLVAVLAVDAAGVWAVSRLVRYGGWRRPQPRIRIPLQGGQPGAELVAGERFALPGHVHTHMRIPTALPAGRPVVRGVVVSESERIGA